MSQVETQRGIIISIVTEKNFGFIRQEDGSDIFFHAMGCISPSFEELREGQEVDYLVVPGPNDRKRAIGVVVV